GSSTEIPTQTLSTCMIGTTTPESSLRHGRPSVNGHVGDEPRPRRGQARRRPPDNRWSTGGRPAVNRWHPTVPYPTIPNQRERERVRERTRARMARQRTHSLLPLTI